MEHIRLRLVGMTSSSCPIITALLDKIKSISCDLHGDCKVINTTMLKQIKLVNLSNSANCK